MTGDEEKVRRSWLRAARTWAGSVEQRVMGPFRQAGLPPDASMVLSASGVWVEQVNEQVRPSLLEVVRSSFRRDSGTPPPGFDQSQYVTDYLDASVNRMSNTPDSVYREIAGIIARGIDQQLPVEQIALRVDGYLQVTGVDWWEQRAIVVARTEAGAATNAGTLAAGAHRQQTSGRPVVKRWQARVGSETTRPAHRAADGQTVTLTEPFTVDGETLQYPGDPRGSAGNVIQCRCTLHVAYRDEE